MTIPSDNNPLKDHGDADDLSREGISEPHPLPEDYYHDQNHKDSICIFCWVIVASLVLGLVMLIAHFFSK